MSLLPERCVMCGGEIRDYHSTCHWRHSKEQREGKRDKNYDYLTECRDFSFWYKTEYVNNEMR